MATSLSVLTLVLTTLAAILYSTTARLDGGVLVQPSSFLNALGCTVQTVDGEETIQCQVNNNVTLQLGLPATLPAQTLLAGANCSTFSLPLPSLDLNSLAGVFVVPPNGSVALQGLRIGGAVLPTAPFPLPPASFLALSAFKLPLPAVRLAGSAPPLRLTDLVISTPSCVALSIHQDFACRASPSPNFTVTPTSLLIHRLTTPTANITNVTLLCTGTPLPFPCLAAIASTGASLITLVRTMQEDKTAALSVFGPSAAPQAYVFVNRSLALTEQDLPSFSPSPSASSAPAPGFPTPITLTTLKLTIAGAGSGATVLDLSGTANLFSLQSAATVSLHNLTIQNPPPGPMLRSPYALLRLPLWTFDFNRRLYTRLREPILLLRGCTVTDVPLEEIAMYVAEAAGAAAVSTDEVAPMPPALAACNCMIYNGVFINIAGSLVPNATYTLQVDQASSSGSRSVVQNVTVVAAPTTRGVNAAAATATAAAVSAAGVVPATDPTARNRCGFMSDSICALLPEGDPEPWPRTFRAVQLIIDSALSTSSISLSDAAMTQFGIVALRPVNVYTGGSGQPVAVAAKPLTLYGSPYGPTFINFNGTRGDIVLRGNHASLTIRHLVVVGLPPAVEGAVKEKETGLQLAAAAAGLLGSSSSSLQSGASSMLGAEVDKAQEVKEMDEEPQQQGRRLARRALQQSSQSGGTSSPSPLPPAVAGNAWPSSPTQGLPASLTNFSSCIWSLEFDRVAAAAQGDSKATSNDSGGGRPGGLPYVFLDSVVLVVPQPEVALMAWACAAASLTPNSLPDPGLAEQLAALRAGSVLAAAAPNATAAAVITSLTFERLSWCGLQGRNVTITSLLPVLAGWTPANDWQVAAAASIRLPVPVNLPVVQSSSSPPVPFSPDSNATRPGGGGGGGGSEAPLQPTPAPSPPLVPMPTAGAGAFTSSLAGDARGGMLPGQLGGVVAGIVGLVVAGAALASVVLLLRRRRWAMQQKQTSDDCRCGGTRKADAAAATGAVGDGSAHGGASVEGSVRTGGRKQHGRKWGSEEGCRSDCSSSCSGGGGSQHGLEAPSAVEAAQHAVAISCEGEAPLAGSRGSHSARSPTAVAVVATATTGQARRISSQVVPGSLLASSLGSRLPRIKINDMRSMTSNRSARNTVMAMSSAGSASASPAATSMLARALKRLYALHDTLADASEQPPLRTGTGIWPVTDTISPGNAPTESNGTGSANVNNVPVTTGSASLALEGPANAGDGPSFSAGGGSSGGRACGGDSYAGQQLTISGELGRGGQGVVYRGLWRGLDVAVKSTLLQRARGAGDGTRVHQAIQEAAISASVSHPNVVATYTYMLQRLGPAMPTGLQLGATLANKQHLASISCSGSDQYANSDSCAISLLNTGIESNELEVWKLTLVQELCDGNSLRKCLEQGLLGACQPREMEMGLGAGQSAQTGLRAPATMSANQVLEPPHQQAEEHQPNPAARAASSFMWSPALFLLRRQDSSVGELGNSVGSSTVRVMSAPGFQPSSASTPFTPSRTKTDSQAPRAPQPAYTPMCSQVPFIHDEATLPQPRVVLGVALHIARGLEHLHSRAIVHADVSSANVLLQSEKNRGGGGGGADSGTRVHVGPACSYGFVAKVCDFGLSGRLDVAEDATHLSGPARRSSAYSAPELAGDGRASRAGDVYAFAVLLWELAWGTPLPMLLSRPEGARVAAWLAQQELSGPADVEALPAGLLTWPCTAPPGLPELVGECLEGEGSTRPDMGHVVQQLEGMLLE